MKEEERVFLKNTYPSSVIKQKGEAKGQDGATPSEGPKATSKIGKEKAPLPYYFVISGLGNKFKEDPKVTNMNVKVNK